MRYNIFDGFRGFFLLFMGIIHLNVELDTIIGKLNHHYFGWVEDAQGFVFISGFVVGLVYGGAYLKKGRPAMFRKIYGRVRTIYSHQIGLILILLATAFFLSLFSIVPRALTPYINEPVFFTLASTMLVAASYNMGILPMYIYFMVITPFALVIIKRGYTGVIAIICILLWMLAQTGLIDEVTSWGERVSVAMGHPIEFGIFFDIFGWQILFFSGLYSGFKLAEGKLDLQFLKQPVYTIIFLIGLLGFFLLGVFDRVIFDFWISNEFSETFLQMTSRNEFSVIYVVAFYLDLFLVTWILVAGRTCGISTIEKLGHLVNWIFTRRFLVFLGQHSLHVFSYHILLVYLVSIWRSEQPVPELMGSIILLLGAASLYIPAWLHARVQNRNKGR